MLKYFEGGFDGLHLINLFLSCLAGRRIVFGGLQHLYVCNNKELMEI